MPGCGCAAPPSSGRPVNVPQSRGYLPTPPSSGGAPMASSFSSPSGGGPKASSFSSPATPAYGGSISAYNAPPAADGNAAETLPAERSLSRSTQKYQPDWKSPLKTFDNFASKVLRQKAEAEEDFPKLTMPTFRGLHKCKVSALNYHQVDLALELEQELRNIGIQGTMMMEHLEKLLKAEAACQFQGAVRAAELAAMAAPNGLAEEAAVAASRGYSVDAQQFSRMATGDNPIEIVGYIGCTRPDNF
ncbi:uncharacterized protein LOC111051277 [Nilaparvata lugens]|uniref:uncharacterized protein LOC111051277 n=1 Tax=Nilaparvata lugens TaxID=108931 RepID=UPI00193D7B9C|nr:uncharacterized protein LOC111051277 [Nilaparvata lugens]